MGSSRILFLLSLGAILRPGAPEPDPGEAPRPRAEASATVTVTAESGPVEVLRTPNAVTVIDKGALEARRGMSLGDVLQDLMPGRILASGGVGTAASIYLGGTRPQDTVVTLDGLRLTDASGLGGVNAGVVDLLGIDRIEVQQGPCSTRYGSDALGGAVTLSPAGSAPEGLSGEVRAGAGTHAIRKEALSAAYGWGRGWVRVAGSTQREQPGLETDRPFRNQGVYLGLGLQAGENTLVTLNGFNTFSGVPVPIVWADFGTAPRGGYQYNPAREDTSRAQILGGAVRTVFTPTLSGEFTLGQALQDRLEPSQTTGLPEQRYSSLRNQSTASLTLQLPRSSSLQVGLDGSKEVASSPQDATRLYASARHLALYVEGQTEPLPRLRLVASLRGERDRQTVPLAGGGSRASAITQVTGKAGANLLLPAGFRLYASLGTGFSNPLLFNSVWNAQYRGEVLANERSRTAQAGLTWTEGPWKGGLELSRTLFSNLVTYDPTGGVYIPDWFSYTGIYRNGSRIRVQGAEFKGGYQTATWGVQAFYRNQEARDTLAPREGQLSSSAVLRRPFQTLGLSSNLALGTVRLATRWSWVGPRYEFGPTRALKTHFNDLGASAAWDSRKDLTFTLRGDHLLQPRTTRSQWLARTHDLDNDASQIFGYPAQPPTATLELRYRF